MENKVTRGPSHRKEIFSHKTQLGQFSVVCQLREGINRVYGCLNRKNDFFSIIEIENNINWSSLDKRTAVILGGFREDYIVSVKGVIIRDTHFYIVNAFYPLDLLSFIKLGEDLKSPRKRNGYLHQIITAVARIHSHDVYHGDLIPQNIFVDYSIDKIKLGNFNLTNHKTPMQYRAPELLLGSEDHTLETDMWSVGCIFAEMVAGVPLFTGRDEEDLLKTIQALLDHGLTWGLEYLFLDLEPEEIDLLWKLLSMDPTDRISAKEALSHEIFKMI